MRLADTGTVFFHARYCRTTSSNFETLSLVDFSTSSTTGIIRNSGFSISEVMNESLLASGNFSTYHVSYSSRACRLVAPRDERNICPWTIFLYRSFAFSYPRLTMISVPVGAKKLELISQQFSSSGYRKQRENRGNRRSGRRGRRFKSCQPDFRKSYFRNKLQRLSQVHPVTVVCPESHVTSSPEHFSGHNRASIRFRFEANPSAAGSVKRRNNAKAPARELA